MSDTHRVIIYCAMLLFDFSVLAGTIWLIEYREWSVWWLLLAYITTDASCPGNLMKWTKQ